MRDSVMKAQLESGKATITRLTSELKRLEDRILEFYQAKKDLVVREREGDHVRPRAEFGRAELAFFTLAEEILVRKMGRAIAPEHVTLDPTTIGQLPTPRRRRRRTSAPLVYTEGTLTTRGPEVHDGGRWTPLVPSDGSELALAVGVSPRRRRIRVE